MIYTKEIPKAEGLYPVRFRFGGGWAHGVAAAPRSTRIGFVHKNGAVQVLNERDVEWGPAIEFGEAEHSCDNCGGIDPDSCAFNRQDDMAHERTGEDRIREIVIAHKWGEETKTKSVSVMDLLDLLQTIGALRESDDGAERPIIGMVGERILTRQDQCDEDGYLIRHDPRVDEILERLRTDYANAAAVDEMFAGRRRAADGIRKRLGKLEQTVARSTERTQKLARLMENYIRKGLSKLDVEDKVYGFRSFSEHFADEAHKIATGAEPTGCEKCQECGRRYETCYRVPDDTWAQISGRSDGSGLLCISCADQLARNAGITIWWRGTGREFTKWEDGQR